MEIKFRGKYDKNLFFRSVRLANQPSRNQRFLQPLMLVFVVVALGVLVVRLVNSGDLLGNASYIVVIMIAGSFVARAYMLPYLAAQKLWVNPSVQTELGGIVTRKGITYSLKQGQNEIPWNRFRRIRRAIGLTTLVTRDGLLVIFPKHFFKSDTDWLRFNQLVDSSIIVIK
ncbi:MAG: YcxB family protein [Chloroflexota bacterium]